MRRLSFAKNVTEQRMVEMITEQSPFKDPHLASLYSATLNEDDFMIDEATNQVKPVSENFLKNQMSSNSSVKRGPDQSPERRSPVCVRTSSPNKA